MLVGTVAALFRYPVKSMRGERLERITVEPGGFTGDRAWACLDAADGTVGSAKHPRRWGRLLELSAQGANESATIDIAGTRVRAGTAEADVALSAYLGRAVRLVADVPSEARLHRLVPGEAGMVPEWMAAAPGQETVTAIAGAKPGGRFVDFGAVHIVTTGALDVLGTRLGRDSASALRFRPNLVIDAERDPEPGAAMRIGDAVLRVVLPTPRCIVPSLDHGDGAPADPALLSVLARHYRTAVGERGRAACFGVFAEVVEPGEIRYEQQVLQCPGG